MKPRAPKAPIRRESTDWVDLPPITLALLLLGVVGSSHAESVYRCGNSYSSSAQCASAAATEITANSAPRQHTSTLSTIAQQEQREAHALEKQRLQSERQATPSAPVRVVVVPTESQSTAAQQTPRQSKRPQKASSPYFTARDPIKPDQKASKN